MDVGPEMPRSLDLSAATTVLSNEQSTELMRRRADGLSDPALMIDWSIVRAELRKRRTNKLGDRTAASFSSLAKPGRWPV